MRLWWWLTLGYLSSGSVGLGHAQSTLASERRKEPFDDASRPFQSLRFFRTCPRAGACGVFSSLMHRGTRDTTDCLEFCVLFPRLWQRSSLECGGCGTIPLPTTSNGTSSSSSGTANETYTITLDLKGIPAVDMAIFQNASQRWSNIVTSGLTDTNTSRFPPLSIAGCTYPAVIDDLYICAAYGDIDGPSGVLGSAGPLRTRSTNGLPVVGSMLFDGPDVPALQADGDFLDTIVHELGHVMGLGTLWDDQGIAGLPPAGCPYTGANAAREFQVVSRCPRNAVPTEQDGGRGTECGHWDEECLLDELMTGFIDGPAALSRITIASLDDLGYQVSYATADEYTFSDLGRQCTCRPPRPRQRRLRNGETRQFGLGTHPKVQRRRLSEASHQMAVDYGQTVLAERAVSESKRISPDDADSTIFIGDQVISVLVLEGGQVYGVVVRREK